jgi:hypothetical protein
MGMECEWEKITTVSNGVVLCCVVLHVAVNKGDDLKQRVPHKSSATFLTADNQNHREGSGVRAAGKGDAHSI